MLFSINTSKPQLSRKEVSFRKTKAVDTRAFMEDLSASRLCQDPPSQPEKLVDCYNTTQTELLDRYTPPKTKTVTVRPQVHLAASILSPHLYSSPVLKPLIPVITKMINILLDSILTFKSCLKTYLFKFAFSL